MAKDKQQQKPKQQPAGAGEEYTVKDYVYINIFFWAFLFVVAMVVFFTTGAKFDAIMQNVFMFIFLVFGLGFTAVSVFDYIYEKTAKKNENAE